jgi:Tol biopolymer transport system component
MVGEAGGTLRSPQSRRGAQPVLFAVTAVLLSLAALGSVATAGGSAVPVTVLVSRVGPNGPGGDGNSLTPSISASSRYIAFASRANNLSSAASGGRLEIYVRDMTTRQTVLVSRLSGPSGVAANGYSADPSISADGRYVAFRSNAENLSPDDTAFNDIFVRDLLTDTTTLVSRATDNSAADGESGAPAISADGRHVAFESEADNLSADDTDGNTVDIFARDLDTGATSLISRATGATGAGGTDLSFNPSISADGRYVAFSSRAPLTPDDVDEPSFPEDVFVRDQVADTTVLVSRATGATGAPSEVNSEDPAISADGRYVAFASDAKLTGQGFFDRNVFVRDLVDNTTALASVGDEGEAGDARRNPSISADGRYVAFETRGNDLSPVDADGRVDVFVRDMQDGLTVVASRASGRLGVPADGPSFNASISSDGRYVAFDSRATNLSGADQDRYSDVFRRRLVHGPESALPQCAGRVATVIGTGGRDVLKGTKRKDVILGLGGNDRIKGFDGADVICGDAGRDRVWAGTNDGGGGGSDLVLGGPGSDRISLGAELGRARGGAGSDLLIGSSGGDGLYGGSGDDLLRGLGNPHFNSDFLFGGPGNDSLFGGPGPDQLHGGPGRDHLDGGPGHNEITQRVG